MHHGSSITNQARLHFQTKSSSSGAFDDFDPFSGPLLSPTAAPATSQKDDLASATSDPFAASGSDPFGTSDPFGADDKTAESVSTSDDLFGTDAEVPVADSGKSEIDNLDPFGLSEATTNTTEDNNMAAEITSGDMGLEAQFDDLIGGFSDGQNVVSNGEIIMTETTETTSEEQSSQVGTE